MNCPNCGVYIGEGYMHEVGALTATDKESLPTSTQKQYEKPKTQAILPQRSRALDANKAGETYGPRPSVTNAPPSIAGSCGSSSVSAAKDDYIAVRLLRLEDRFNKLVNKLYEASSL
jgi:hypothetical protein